MQDANITTQQPIRCPDPYCGAVLMPDKSVPNHVVCSGCATEYEFRPYVEPANCGNCAYADSDCGNPVCRRHAPVRDPADKNDYRVFPSAPGWCGEHKRRTEA